MASLVERVHENKLNKLREASKAYQDGDFSRARQLFQDASSIANLDNKSRLACRVNIACSLGRVAKHGAALELLADIIAEQEDNEDDDDDATLQQIIIEALYNKSLCEYKLNKFSATLSSLQKLFEVSRKHFPHLHNLTYELVERDANLIQDLRSSCLVEAINLKASALYKLKADCSAAAKCLDSLPFRYLCDLDPISKHNVAIYSHLHDSRLSLNILKHLLELTSGISAELDPQQVRLNFMNICIRCSKFAQSLTDYQLDLSDPKAELLHLLLGDQSQIDHESRNRRLDKLLDRALKEHEVNPCETSLEMVLVVACTLGSIFWDSNQFVSLERLINKTSAILKDNNIWQINVAHFNFIQDTRFETCCKAYETIVDRGREPSNSLLSVDPTILANLCISYVLTGRNSDAEELIKEVENDESSLMTSADQTRSLVDGVHLTSEAEHSAHISIINLAIGTLYCVKHNFQFGLSRVFKSVEPMDQNLNHLTWHHVKRCLLFMLECHCKHLVDIDDETFEQVISFLKKCEIEGLSSLALDQVITDEIGQLEDKFSSIAGEARYLRSITLTIVHD